MANRPSFEEIDYTVRPAKCIERKMIGEFISLLQAFRQVKNYRYVGLGSTFFTDFVLYHKNFGINEMCSIEMELTKRNRIDFNIPFKCIKVEYGETTQVLSRLSWAKPTIVWLDYDKPLEYKKASDFSFLAQNLVSSSMLIVTLPADPRHFDQGKKIPDLDIRRSELNKALKGRMPDIENQDLADLGKAIRKIANSEIEYSLSQTNAAKNKHQKIESNQIMYFKYADGVSMLTLGWLFLNKKDFEKYKNSKINQLPFYRSGDVPYRIVPPKLTLRERKHLDTQLPGGEPTRCPDVPAEDLAEYSKLYRYFPAFVEAEI